MRVAQTKVTNNGHKVFAIENDNGMRVELLSFGAIISKLIVPTRSGEFVDVVAGYENEDDFESDTCYFNAFIGRVCNRIEKGRFKLDGKEYKLFKNDGNNHLHGGKSGFNKQEYSVELGENYVKFSRLSPDGEEGYPGNLFVSVKYTLTNDNALTIDYEATTDKATPCALTNHAYFNLDGDFESVLDTELCIAASRLTDIDDELIPHGDYLDVKDTPYDFTTPKKIGRDIKANDRLLNIARGYDFNFVLDKQGLDKAQAWAYSEKSGVRLEVYTDRPCIQLYTGNFLDGVKGKKTYGYQSAFCLETQSYPNAVNVESFGDVVLKAGQKYASETRYVFSVK